MIVELPEWRPFSAGASPWTPEPSDRGRVVVALAPAPSRRDQWSAGVVLDLLDAWSQSGHRVVLADCVLEHPTLHRSAGLSNDEGISDAALFGASVSRVARSVPGRSFFFIGAGAPVGDAEAVLASPRWVRLQQGFRDAGVTFVAFVREGCAGEADLVGDADDVMILAETAEAVPSGVGAAAGKVRAVVGPSTSPAGGEAVTPEPVELPDPVPSVPRDAGSDPSDDVDDDAAGAPEHEPVMDFSDPAAAAAEQADGPPAPEAPAHVGSAPGVHEPEAEPAGPSPARPSRTRRAGRGADPDARKKLLWVAVVVLVLVVLVVLGALG